MKTYARADSYPRFPPLEAPRFYRFAGPESERAAAEPPRGYPLKRPLDFTLALTALLLLSPALLLIAAVIWFDDPHGSPLYVSERCGEKGRVFRFYKFRTMRVDADKQLDALLSQNEADGPAFKMRDDPRITRVGKFLRKTSLDELLQLWNVIRGDMSIVGPRPPLLREARQYTPRQMERLSVKPGLTCYWQILPERNRCSFSDWVELDRKYIRECSFRVDAAIVLRTFWAVFSCQGE